MGLVYLDCCVQNESYSSFISECITISHLVSEIAIVINLMWTWILCDTFYFSGTKWYGRAERQFVAAIGYSAMVIDKCNCDYFMRILYLKGKVKKNQYG